MDSAAKERVEFVDAAFKNLLLKPIAMLGRDQAWKNHHAAAFDHHVVKAFSETHATQLHDVHCSPRHAIPRRILLHTNHAMRDALDLCVAVARSGSVVKQQHRAITS